MKETTSPLLHVLRDLPEYNRLCELVTDADGPAAAFGLPESARAHIFAALAQQCGGLYVCADDHAARRAFAFVSALTDNAAYLPARETPLINTYASAGTTAKARIAALVRLSLGEPVALITSVEAAMQALAPPEVLRAATRTLHIGETCPPRALLTHLAEAGYEVTDLTEAPGQVSLRGDILDVFSPQLPLPCRVEFFDDEIDRMGTFDPETQRTIDRLSTCLLAPATEAPQDQLAIARGLSAIKDAKGFDAQRIAFESGRGSPGAEALIPVLYAAPCDLFAYLPARAPICVEELPRVAETAQSMERLFTGRLTSVLVNGEGLSAQAKLHSTANELFFRLNTPRTALFYALNRHASHIRARETVQFSVRTAPQYRGDCAELVRDIQNLRNTGEAVLLFAGTHAERLSQQLFDEGCETALMQDLHRLPLRGEAAIVPHSLPQGLVYPALHLHLYTEVELFGTAREAQRKHQQRKDKLVFSELRPGDYVVHEAHGIGRFEGVETLVVQDITKDYLLMRYASGDQLYIPTDQLDRVQKYIGADDAPKLSKLGGSDWQRQVGRARAAVKELAFDLAKLYAERQSARGFAFSKDSAWQAQMEEQFPYEETPDQAQSIQQIKRDMESERVMDRLLCGDVGYGKTEVALRAAFKAVQDSKQTAFLVPTTILAQQHYNTLCTRFAGFPVRVAMLSRFHSAQENKKIKAQLATGQVDIVVGTHALLAKDVHFRELGLLIIDEEHRFGVGHKEQMKNLRKSVDVLTLTATPIPRTLHMSMVGIRDMSVLETPPEDRHPVQNYVLEYSDTLLTDAVRKELSRGGQCYIVYNNVKGMEYFSSKLRTLLPEANIAYAHGQMPEQQLERTMLAFMEGTFDVLLCSTIIESGLDIPNVNTMIVVDANKMGLAQLYQLRGRVGRSNRLGYAYFTFEKDKELSEIAHRRLGALTEFAQFGAGREIALRDLEIRGAGSLLGAQQHGHIADVGYEYYCKLMGAAVKEARGEEAGFEVDPVVDIPLDAHIPKDYILNEVQRLSMYKRIAMIRDEPALLDVQEELEDRYGDIPAATQNLMDIALVKAYCARAQAPALTIRAGSAKLVFHENAALDGAKLLHAATAYGAKLQPGETLALLYERAAAEPAELLRLLRPLLLALQ